jgi:hypothetical protein
MSTCEAIAACNNLLEKLNANLSKIVWKRDTISDSDPCKDLIEGSNVRLYRGTCEGMFVTVTAYDLSDVTRDVCDGAVGEGTLIVRLTPEIARLAFASAQAAK